MNDPYSKFKEKNWNTLIYHAQDIFITRIKYSSDQVTILFGIGPKSETVSVVTGIHGTCCISSMVQD